MLNIRKYFSTIILLTVAVGFIFPALGLFLKPFLSYILMVMMTISALRIDLNELKISKLNWWRYLMIQAVIFFVPMVLVWLLRPLFSKEVYVGLVVVAAAPSAIAVVFMSDLLGGSPSMALVATTLAHLISPIVTPLLIWTLVHTSISVPFLDILWLIVKLVIIPLVVANLIKKIPGHQKIVSAAHSLNTGLLVLILLGIVGPAQTLFLNNKFQTLLVMLVVTVILVVEIFIGFWFGRGRSEQITLAIIGSNKNFTLSSVIALNFFGSAALLGSVAFGVVANLMILPLQIFISNNKKSN